MSYHSRFPCGRHTLTLAMLLLAPALASARTVSNPVVSVSVSGARGGSIDSLRVLGVETIDTTDLGREIQASLFFPSPAGQIGCNGAAAPTWYNPQDAGDICGRASPLYAINNSDPVSTGEIHVGVYPYEWAGRGAQPAGLRMEGHHKVGPLPYAPYNEVVKLGYLFINGSGASLPFMTSVYDSAGQPTPVPFVPAIYFKASVLNRLFGLRFDGVWEEVGVNSSNGAYTPSKYRYFAMAWMRQDLGWGVGLYARATLGQATNFVAQRFIAQGTNNLSVVDQTLGTLGPYASVGREPHLAVGNLGTIKNIFFQVYNSGK